MVDFVAHCVLAHCVVIDCVGKGAAVVPKVRCWEHAAEGSLAHAPVRHASPRSRAHAQASLSAAHDG